MIYQLKITLKYIKPPIWRRVEVRDSMTFYDLHRIIQNSFDWEDYHLHSFDIKRSAGTSTNHLITIGPMNQEKIKFLVLVLVMIMMRKSNFKRNISK